MAVFDFQILIYEKEKLDSSLLCISFLECTKMLNIHK